MTAARPVPDRWTGTVTGRIVVGGRVLLDASFRAVRVRLGILDRDGMLARASEVAYGEAVTGLVKAVGPAAGLTRLAGVRLGGLAGTDDCTHIGLRWEAIAADGTLFTALDADLMLVPVADQVTALALAGAYGPQPGWGGAGLEQAMVRECATAAVRSFLDLVACALVHPAGTEGPGRVPADGYRTAGRQGQAAMCFTSDRPGGYLLGTRSAAPGFATNVTVDWGVGRSILGLLMLIIAGFFALLAGLLTGAVTALRRAVPAAWCLAAPYVRRGSR
jgi:hypothetical protein